MKPLHNEDTSEKPSDTNPSSLRAAAGDAQSSEILELLFDRAWADVKAKWFQTKHAATAVLTEMDYCRLLQKSAEWCKGNPFTTLCLMAGVGSMLLPFLIFAVFGVISMVMFLTGFLFFELTFLTVIAMVLIGLAGFALILAGCLVLAYKAVSMIDAGTPREANFLDELQNRLFPSELPQNGPRHRSQGGRRRGNYPNFLITSES